MDRGGQCMGEELSGRPIILSPPPVDPGNSARSFTQHSANPGQNFQAQRNLSVRFNLQQEFETLKADLDLDLDFSNLAADIPESSEEEHGLAHDSLQLSLSPVHKTPPLGSSNGPNNRLGSSSASVLGNPAGLPVIQNPAGSGNGSSRVLSGDSSLLAPAAYSTNAAHSPYGMHAHNNNSHMNSDSLLLETKMRDGSGPRGLQSLLTNKLTGFPSLLGTINRPQSVNDFSSVLNCLNGQPLAPMQAPSGNFYLDMLQTTSWIETLSLQELMTMLDYWCSNLPYDFLLTMKSRLHSHVLLGLQAPQVFGKINSCPQYNSDFVSDMDSLSFHDTPRSHGTPSVGTQLALLQPKPKTNHAFRSHLFAENVQRPKLADPSMHNRLQHSAMQVHAADRTCLPTSRLYEKTNFLQLAAASHVPHPFSQNSQQNLQNLKNLQGLQNLQNVQQLPNLQNLQALQSVKEGLDDAAAHKFGTLATINSRVALDFTHKVFQDPGTLRGTPSAMAYEKSLNRQSNSSSVPINTQKDAAAAMTAMSGVFATCKPRPDPGLAVRPPVPVSSASMPPDIVNQELLDNISAWLKLLRLHKYTDYLKDMRWQDLVELTDEDLENKGVKTLGARRKLLKAFETVKLSKA